MASSTASRPSPARNGSRCCRASCACCWRPSSRTWRARTARRTRTRKRNDPAAREAGGGEVMAQNDPHVLPAEARTRQRDEAASELVRGLLIINGGGAAALLAFLQAIWSSNKALARPTIVALVILSVGAVLGAAFHLFRHQASWHHQSGDLKRWAKFRRLYLVSASLSLLAFL